MTGGWLMVTGLMRVIGLPPPVASLLRARREKVPKADEGKGVGLGEGSRVRAAVPSLISQNSALIMQLFIEKLLSNECEIGRAHV